MAPMCVPAARLVAWRQCDLVHVTLLGHLDVASILLFHLLLLVLLPGVAAEVAPAIRILAALCHTWMVRYGRCCCSLSLLDLHFREGISRPPQLRICALIAQLSGSEPCAQQLCFLQACERRLPRLLSSPASELSACVLDADQLRMLLLVDPRREPRQFLRHRRRRLRRRWQVATSRMNMLLCIDDELLANDRCDSPFCCTSGIKLGG
eukprot:CAMPEP_0183346606 /NCGR_PEP_ID=MMETSP0164_2-20130417/11676_1 /TAXON_ID=221442 /ORGANISM="Coccolithus pelagicus ssp braarudi, Strain PLY182g" /LENGTH=207 /DNA_ID=CAMNT_0025517907 /DNA_START=230 /DNA_END=853 /DNA_ORIENTATION=-